MHKWRTTSVLEGDTERCRETARRPHGSEQEKQSQRRQRHIEAEAFPVPKLSSWGRSIVQIPQRRPRMTRLRGPRRGGSGGHNRTNRTVVAAARMRMAT